MTAIILNQAALHDDNTIATHSIAKLIMIKSLLCGFMFGMNRNAVFNTRYIANAAPYAVWSL